MIEGQIRCVNCGSVFSKEDIGITGQCHECCGKRLEEHDLLMRTIIWRETSELVPPGKHKGEG